MFCAANVPPYRKRKKMPGRSFHCGRDYRIQNCVRHKKIHAQTSRLVFGDRIEVPAWFHPFMEDADDLKQSRHDRPIVEHMHWLPYLRLRSIAARMPQMKTAN